MFGRSAKVAQKEYEKLQADIQQLYKDFEAMDKEFETWKERVLAFEHSQLGSDDHSGDDDRVCDGECVRAGEDESNLQQSVEQTDSESSGSSTIDEEGGQSDT